MVITITVFLCFIISCYWNLKYAFNFPFFSRAQMEQIFPKFSIPFGEPSSFSSSNHLMSEVCNNTRIFTLFTLSLGCRKKKRESFRRNFLIKNYVLMWNGCKRERRVERKKSSSFGHKKLLSTKNDIKLFSITRGRRGARLKEFLCIIYISCSCILVAFGRARLCPKKHEIDGDR